MPFPELGGVGTTKGDEMAVPKLNEHQRSWILDVGVRGIDLPGLKGKAATEFYEKVKTDAFEAKAFKHTPQGMDGTEEARLPVLVAAWKQKCSKKSNNSAADDDDASDQEEDKSGRGGLLGDTRRRGGERRLSVTSEGLKISNARQERRHRHHPIAEAPALSQLLGLVASSGRTKFREDRHDDIEEYSKTLTDAINAGAKFRKAEAIMWAEEDQASWEAQRRPTRTSTGRMASGFKHMVDSLHASGKFHPFVATMLMGWVDEEAQVHLEWWSRVEAVPKDIRHTPQLVKDSLNAMYAWAEKPLKDYVATLEDSTKDAPQVFPLSAESLDDMSPKALAQTVTNFLADSYYIPWAAVASTPKEYYDAEISFTSTGLVQLTVAQWYELTATLVSVAGTGTSGFFRKAPAGQDDEEEDRADEDARRADEAKAEAAGRADEAKAEVARLADEVKVEAARLADEAKAEAARREGKGGRKRKAESQLVPEDDASESAGPARRTTRTRLTPQLRIRLGPEESGQIQAKLYEQNLSCAATEDPVELELCRHSSPWCNEENSSSRRRTQVSTYLKYRL
ncbi:hypothetical protein B0H13DRAFT_1887758 [Mycena leptocephala]|nr:hypothetical protein B0H13DRAFT_1887758 [Mycena leptocephala]